MNKLSSKFLLAAFACVTALLGTPAHAFNPQPAPPKNALIGFGMVGLVAGQTMRLNIVNYGGPDTRPCAVEVLIFDAVGTVVASETATVEPGEAVSSNFTPISTEPGTPGIALTTLLPDDNGRFQLRAAVRGIVNPNVSPVCRNLRGIVPTLEVFNGSGETSLFVLPAIQRFVTDVDD